MSIPSPCFVLDEKKLIQNLELIDRVQKQAGVQIILALKGFSMWSVFPTVRKYIRGATASSLNEARLCCEEMGVKPYTYFVAYSEEDFGKVVSTSSHITFNSLSQYEKFIDRVPKKISVGLRVNPECSDVEIDLYNPSSPASRLGVTHRYMQTLPSRIEGLHFHVLCESDSYALEKVLDSIKNKFGKFLPQIKWINMGGGHLITHEEYNVDHLIGILSKFKAKYDVEIILEPGSAFAWKAGDLYTKVLDVVEGGEKKTIIFDASFTCHMPDCLEMPYRPHLAVGSNEKIDGWHPYRLGGVSCLAGDYLDDYWFEETVKVGDSIIFKDMIHYTMVKTSSFNGIKHPSIGILREGGNFELIKEFGYKEFKNRLS